MENSTSCKNNMDMKNNTNNIDKQHSINNGCCRKQKVPCPRK